VGGAGEGPDGGYKKKENRSKRKQNSASWGSPKGRETGRAKAWGSEIHTISKGVRTKAQINWLNAAKRQRGEPRLPRVIKTLGGEKKSNFGCRGISEKMEQGKKKKNAMVSPTTGSSTLWRDETNLPDKTQESP